MRGGLYPRCRWKLEGDQACTLNTPLGSPAGIRIIRKKKCLGRPEKSDNKIRSKDKAVSGGKDALEFPQ